MRSTSSVGGDHSNGMTAVMQHAWYVMLSVDVLVPQTTGVATQQCYCAALNTESPMSATKDMTLSSCAGHPRATPAAPTATTAVASPPMCASGSSTCDVVAAAAASTDERIAPFKDRLPFSVYRAVTHILRILQASLQNQGNTPQCTLLPVAHRPSLARVQRTAMHPQAVSTAAAATLLY